MALQPFARKVVDLSQARSSNAREIIPSHVADIERSMKEEIRDNEFPILVYVHSQHKMDALESIDARLPYPVTILNGHHRLKALQKIRGPKQPLFYFCQLYEFKESTKSQLLAMAPNRDLPPQVADFPSTLFKLIYSKLSEKERENVQNFGTMRPFKEDEIKLFDFQSECSNPKSISTYTSYAKSLFVYYYFDSGTFKEFEKALFFPSVRDGRKIKKWSTLRVIVKIPYTFIKQAIPFFDQTDYKSNQRTWVDFCSFFNSDKRPGYHLIQALETEDFLFCYNDFWPELSKESTKVELIRDANGFTFSSPYNNYKTCDWKTFFKIRGRTMNDLDEEKETNDESESEETGFCRRQGSRNKIKLTKEEVGPLINALDKRSKGQILDFVKNLALNPLTNDQVTRMKKWLKENPSPTTQGSLITPPLTIRTSYRPNQNGNTNADQTPVVEYEVDRSISAATGGSNSSPTNHRIRVTSPSSNLESEMTLEILEEMQAQNAYTSSQSTETILDTQNQAPCELSSDEEATSPAGLAFSDNASRKQNRPLITPQAKASSSRVPLSLAHNQESISSQPFNVGVGSQNISSQLDLNFSEDEERPVRKRSLDLFSSLESPKCQEQNLSTHIKSVTTSSSSVAPGKKNAWYYNSKKPRLLSENSFSKNKKRTQSSKEAVVNQLALLKQGLSKQK